MRNYRSTVFTLVFLGIFAFFMGTAAAEMGVTDTTVKIGTIQDTTGPIAAYGIPRVEVLQAYIKQINDAGGIHGRKFSLHQESDNYKPPQAVLAFKKLLEIDQIFCHISSLGVAATMANMPEIQKRKVPYVMIGGASAHFFYPLKRYMFGLWGLYDDYGRMQVDYVANTLKMPNARIAHIQQDDETGKDNHRGILLQMKKYPGIKLVSHEKFKRGTVDVSSQVANMKRANTDVVLISPIFVSAAMIAKEMYKIGWKPPMVMNATAASQLLIKLGGKAVEGAYVQFTNNIMSEDHIPGVREYKALMKKYFPKSKASPSTYGISGFYEAKIAFEGIKRAGRNLTREGLVDAMETIKNFDTQGMGPVSFSSTDHMGNHSIRWFKVQNGKFVNLSGWVDPK